MLTCFVYLWRLYAQSVMPSDTFCIVDLSCTFCCCHSFNLFRVSLRTACTWKPVSCFLLPWIWLVSSVWKNVGEDVPLVEFMYLVFTRMPGKSYGRRLRSLLLYSCYVFNRKTHGFRTFSHFGPHIWNNLPQDIRHSATLSSFKKSSSMRGNGLNE